MSCKPTYKGKRYNSIQEIEDELGTSLNILESTFEEFKLVKM